MLKRTRRVITSTVVVLVAMGVCWSTAVAQDQVENSYDSEDQVLEEVIVVATRREVSVQDLSVAVSAYTSGFRDEIGMTGVQDIADFTPGLTAQDSPNDRLNIRGVGRQTNAPGSDPGVGVYLDGVYTSGTGVMNGTTLTVERIEVLRGPQGTLYGRNTVGGAVNVISKRPTDEFYGHARTMIGNYNHSNIGATLSGPLSENFRVRLDVRKEERDGYITNIGAGNDIATDANFEVAGQFEWDISDRLNLWVRASYYEYDKTPHFRVIRTQWPNNIFHEGLVIHPWWQYTEENPAIKDPWTIRQNEDQTLNTENSSIQTHLTYEAENFTAKYIGGYNDWDWAMHYDGDGVDRTELVDVIDAAGIPWSVPVAGTVDTSEVKDFQSHELQFLSNNDGPLSWIVGLYYYKEDIESDWDWRIPGNEWLMNAYLDGSQLNWWETGTVSLPNPESRGWYEGGKLKADSLAIYGNFDYELNEKWKINAGLRYTDDTKEGDEFQQWWWMPQNWWEGPNGPLYSLWDTATATYMASSMTNGLDTDSHKESWDSWTGTFAVEYQPNDHSMWYGKISNGTKSGSFLLGALANIEGTARNEAVVLPEELVAYEVGYKAEFAGKFRLNAAAYFYDYEDMQTYVWVKRGSLNFHELHNAHKAESYGLELEALWQIGEHTQLNLAASFAESELTDFCGDRAEAGANDSYGCLVNWQLPGEAYDPSGNPITNTPEQTFAANISHNIPLDSGLINLNATYAYVGDMWYAMTYHEGSQAPSYDRVDLRASWAPESDRYRVYLYVKNALDDERPTVVGQDGPYYGPLDWAYYSYPRVYGVEIHFNW